LVIDDGSSDGTLDVLKTIDDPRLKVISKANAGVAAARNTGFAEGTGEYIAFIDADDRWLSDKLESEVAVLRQHAKPGESPACLVYSAYEAVDENNRLIFRPPIRTQSGDLAKAVIEDEGIFLPSTTLLHRSVYEKVGGFNGECHHEDRAFFILACQHFPAYPTSKRLTLYRQTTAGRCRSILKDYDYALSAEESIVEVLKPRLHPEAAARLAMLQRRNLLYRFMMYDCPQNARRLFQHAFAENPDMLSLIQGKKGLLTKVALKTSINFPCQIRKWVQGLNRVMISPFWASQKRIRPILSEKVLSK
jgi:glycosyltransferase involved in cell wall biosynthesis